MCVPDDCWSPARDSNGEDHDGAEVVEITGLVDLVACPDGTRLIVHRERPHPGAQLTPFATIEGLRHTASSRTREWGISVSRSGEPYVSAVKSAGAEAVNRDTKACGLANLPFDCVVPNDLWMQLTFTAHDLMSWAQRVSLTGRLAKATPKTIHQRVQPAVR